MLHMQDTHRQAASIPAAPTDTQLNADPGTVSPALWTLCSHQGIVVVSSQHIAIWSRPVQQSAGLLTSLHVMLSVLPYFSPVSCISGGHVSAS